MTKEFFDILKEISGALRSIAADFGYLVDKARQADAKDVELDRATTPAPAPQKDAGDS